MAENIKNTEEILQDLTDRLDRIRKNEEKQLEDYIKYEEQNLSNFDKYTELEKAEKINADKAIDTALNQEAALSEIEDADIKQSLENFNALAKEAQSHVGDFNLEELERLEALFKGVPGKNVQELRSQINKRQEVLLGITNETLQSNIDRQREETPAATTTSDKLNSETVNTEDSLSQAKTNTDKAESQVKDDIYRVRSQNSDENEFLMDKIKLKSYLDIGVINEEIYNAGIAHPTNAIEKLQELRPLKEDEVKKFDAAMLENCIENEKLFVLIPPRVLAEQYERLQDKKAQRKETNDENVKAAEAKEDTYIKRLEDRMLALSEDLYNNTNLFFADITNSCDTYESYIKMTDVLNKYVVENEQDADKKAELEQMLQANKDKLEDDITDYDKSRNLENVSEERAGEISKRFETLNSMMDKVEIDEETLGLVSNFHFITNGEQEKPFVNEQGEKSTTYTPGATIDPESKLATVVRLAKQNALQQMMGGTEEITQESLNKEVSDQLGTALYALHVGDAVVHGALEDPNAFTDETKREAFLKSLTDTTHPIEISDEGFEAGVDAYVNDTAAYADRLNKKLGGKSQLAVDVLDQVKDLDKRAKDRVSGKRMTKRQARIEMAKRGLKGAVSAFLVSGAITVAATATASDVYLTAATLGYNKLAGAALGTGLAVTATIISIRKWRKNRKAEGKPCGLKAALEDPRLMSTVATTAFGGAALGFAATGNPKLAMICGTAALALGSGSNAYFSAKDAHKMGLSRLESVGWGVLNAGVTVAAGFAGRATANYGIDVYNQHHADNKIFQHTEKIGSHNETYDVEKSHMIIDHEALNASSEKFLENNWYKDNPDLLQSRLNALEAAGFKDPAHALLIAHDSGMRAPDNMQMYGGSTSEGNHTVLTEGWARENGVRLDAVDAFKNLFNSDGTVNPKALDAYGELAPHVGEDNFVTRIEDRPVIRELYGDRESTYDHDGKMPMKEETYIDTQVRSVDDYGLVRTNTDLGLGMIGVLPLPKAITKIKERVGSLRDKLLRKPSKIDPTPAPTPIPTPIEEKIPALLLDEYKIVYGHEPVTDKDGNQAEYNHWKKYCDRVEGERQKTAPDKEMDAFLLDRRNELDKVMHNQKTFDDGKNVIKAYEASMEKDGRSGNAQVASCRQSIMQSNLTKDNYNNHMTLSHFTKYMPHYLAKDEVAADGSRNISLNPVLKEKYGKENSKVVMTDLNRYLIEGKDLEASQQRVAGRDLTKRAQELNTYYARQQAVTNTKGNER